MKDAHKLVGQQRQSLETQNSKTQSSLTSTTTNNSTDHSQDKIKQQALWDAVSYLTMLLNEAYPAQFAKAWPRHEDRERARGIWVAALKEYTPTQIKRAAHKAIKSGETFMPSLGTIIRLCQSTQNKYGLAPALQAYHEACNASSKDIQGPWSHIAVYFAAKATGWFFLQSEPQDVVFPVFKHNYQVLCQRVREGDHLEDDIDLGLEDLSRKKLLHIEKEENREMQQHMKEQGVDCSSGRDAFLKILKEFT